MEIEKIFHDLESNQTAEYEDAKSKLLDLFTQNKETWPVHTAMDYYQKTGSMRILDVLTRVQSAHGKIILDQLAEWLKVSSNRVCALNLFSYVVRRHPTWLCLLEKHRLIKDILTLLSNEKDIVPLMSALLCIITLLPIIPNLVPNFLVDLCKVFGHLTIWSYQNANKLPEEKMIHLQLGLQMLFQRLYGMYPCNLLNYLTEFIKRERNSILYHTIKPLLETVRVHPLLITSNTESEVNASRWKEMEPHDVVMECVQLSLPMMHQHCNAEYAHYLPWHAGDYGDLPSGGRNTPAIVGPSRVSRLGTHAPRDLQPYPYGGSIPRFDLGGGSGSGSGSGSMAAIWSPYNEIYPSGPIPLTPTPAYLLQSTTASAAVVAATAVAATTSLNNQLLGVTGSSPPEAAVEATPETTPMKDNIKDMKSSQAPALINPLAVRAICISSQPSSPMRKEQQDQFSFPDISTGEVSSVTTSYDRRLQQVMQDRTNSQSPFQTIEAQTSHNFTPDQYSDASSHATNSTPIPLFAVPAVSAMSAVPSTSGVCVECSESSSRYACKSEGVHLCFGPTMRVLAKGFRRRNRMATYNCNETSYDERLDYGRWDVTPTRDETDLAAKGVAKIRRTKSCLSFSAGHMPHTNDEDLTDCIHQLQQKQSQWQQTQHQQQLQNQHERRLQKSGKMLAIASATKKLMPATMSVASQTVEVLPHTYESSLLRILEESQEMRREIDANVQYPQEKLNKYIQSMQSVPSARSGRECANVNCIDKEQYQLLWLHLQYERYRREIHAERNRRLMGRSRHNRSLEMDRDLLLEQLENFKQRNEDLTQQMEKTVRESRKQEQALKAELTALNAKYQNELDQNKCLRQANENLQASLQDEQTKHQATKSELETQLSRIFNMTAELEHAQGEAQMGLQSKQDLARLEAEFIVMGEVQIKCRDRLAEMENFRARDEELRVLQENYSLEMKDLKQTLEEKTAQLDGAKYKIAELQGQLQNNEKVITEKKRLLKAVKDEYEERVKSLNKKYEVQKTIIIQMEERIIMSLHKPQTAAALSACSPDTDKTDIASSVDRNSPLSTSLASSESFSASLRSTDLRNLQQLVETPLHEVSSSGSMVAAGGSNATIIEGTRLPTLDQAFSASTANAFPSCVAAGMPASAINIVLNPTGSSAAAAAMPHNYDNMPGVSTGTAPIIGNTITTPVSSSHYTHSHLQQQQKR